MMAPLGKSSGLLAAGAALAALATYSLLQEGSNDKLSLEKENSTLSRLLPVAQADEKIPHYGVPGSKHERTFIAIKVRTSRNY
jgi:hypothetical protein